MIHKRIFSPANEHDSNFAEALADLNAKALFGDKGYADDQTEAFIKTLTLDNDKRFAIHRFTWK